MSQSPLKYQKNKSKRLNLILGTARSIQKYSKILKMQSLL